jgi:arsenite-transporting ATPase
LIEKILVFGGKGGVGKSSISSATALKISDLMPDKKILLISFDIAHNLTDLFGLEIGNNLKQINKNLWAIEPDPHIYAEKYTKTFAEKARTLMKTTPILNLIPQLEDYIDNTFNADSIPIALKNAIFFQQILDAEKGSEDIYTHDLQFDIIICDFPPTANMVALFEIPEDQIKVVMKYSLQIISEIRKAMRKFTKAAKYIFPFVKSSEERKGLVEELLEMLNEMEQRGERISELIKNYGSLRLVTIAEKPSYEEIIRAYELSERFINLDAIHVNLLIPEDAANHCDFCKNKNNRQQKYIGQIEQEFKNFKIWKSNSLKIEPIGLDGLRALAVEIYSSTNDPNEILNPLKK